MAIQLVQVEEWKAAAEAEVEGLVQGRQVRAEEWKVVEVVEGLVQGRPTLAAEWKVVEGLVPVRAEEWKVAEVVDYLKSVGTEPLGTTPEELVAIHKAYNSVLDDAAKASGFKPQ